MHGVQYPLNTRKGMWVINKNDAITGQGIQPKRFFDFTWSGEVNGVPVGSGTMVPCVTFGSESKLYIVDHDNYVNNGTLLLRLSEITGPINDPIWQVTPGSTWDSSGLFPTNLSIGGGALDAEQPNTSTTIETDIPFIGNRLLNAVFRNGKIWCTHHSVVPYYGPWNALNVIWYEIRPSAMPNALVQSGIITAPSNEYYYYPSIAVNAREDVLIGFTRSSPSTYAQAAYTGRKMTDPLGTTSPVSVLKLGEDTYIKGSDWPPDFRVRWGDYSATCVDPINDIEMWTIQEYAEEDVGPNPMDDRWGTWWGLACECIAIPGDVNATGGIDLTDVIHLVNYFYDKDRPATGCLGVDPGNCWTFDPICRGDVTGISGITLPDIIYLVNFVYDKDRPATGCLGSSPGNCWVPVATCQCCQTVPVVQLAAGKIR